jgi:Holliday junction resolvase
LWRLPYFHALVFNSQALDLRMVQPMSKARQKGTAAETAVVKWLRANGWKDADRHPLRGQADQGDIKAINNTVLEVKNHRSYQIPAWLREVEAEKQNAKAEFGAIIIKPNGIGLSSVGQWWAVLSVEDFAKLCAKAKL